MHKDFKFSFRGSFFQKGVGAALNGEGGQGWEVCFNLKSGTAAGDMAIPREWLDEMSCFRIKSFLDARLCNNTYEEGQCT